MVLLRPCRTTAAYEAIPERDLRLDLGALEATFHREGWRTLANAGVMLVMQRGTDDVSLFQSGKLLIKTRDPVVAERVWRDFGPLYLPADA